MLALYHLSGNYLLIPKYETMTPTSSFERVLDSVEALSVDEQEALIQLVQRRLTERRREEIAANIARARSDYQAGKVFRGTLEQVMNELRH